MKKSTTVKVIFVIITISILTGCATRTYRHASSSIGKTQQTIQIKDQAAHKTAPPVVIKPGYYVDTQPQSLKKPPAWLSRRVTLRAKNVPFNLLVNRLLRNSKITVAYDQTIKPQAMVSLDYRGTVQGALNSLADQLNYYYTLANSELNWSAFETKTFNISFMPGSATYLVGQSENGNGVNGDAGGGTAISGAGAIVNTNQLNDQQYSNLHADLSVWNDLRATLDQLKSPQGHVIVSESSTMVTVRDHPSNVNAIAQYIKTLNHSLSREVAIQVEVLDVQLDDQSNFGINWNVVAKALGTEFTLTGNLATATNLVASDLVDRSMNSALAGLRIGEEGASNALINALSEQGKISVVTKPEVVTMNNQIASIKITQDTGYIRSVSNSFSGFNGDFVTSTITPGTVTDGFTLYLLPKIQGNKVYMQISSNLSNLVRLEKVSTEPSGDNNNNNRRQQFDAIEVPTLAQKIFNIRSEVHSGSTLIIAGFKRLRDETANAALFGIEPLGGKGAETRRVETLVLITPIILKK